MSRIQKAQSAQRLLADPAFVDACSRAEQTIYTRWVSSLTIEQRESEWHKMQGLHAVKTALAATVNDGRMEAAEQEAKAPVGGATQWK